MRTEAEIERDEWKAQAMKWKDIAEQTNKFKEEYHEQWMYYARIVDMINGIIGEQGELLCDKYPNPDDVPTCGWKNSILRIKRVLNDHDMEFDQVHRDG